MSDLSNAELQQSMWRPILARPLLILVCLPVLLGISKLLVVLVLQTVALLVKMEWLLTLARRVNTNQVLNVMVSCLFSAFCLFNIKIQPF